jgi:hypothetical protein
MKFMPYGLLVCKIVIFGVYLISTISLTYFTYSVNPILTY